MRQESGYRVASAYRANLGTAGSLGIEAANRKGQRPQMPFAISPCYEYGPSIHSMPPLLAIFRHPRNGLNPRGLGYSSEGQGRRRRPQTNHVNVPCVSGWRTGLPPPLAFDTEQQSPRHALFAHVGLGVGKQGALCTVLCGLWREWYRELKCTSIVSESAICAAAS